MRNSLKRVVLLNSASGLLDNIADVQGVYSVRRLRGSYSGNCLELRRSSDDATMDFGFDSDGDLDTAAVTTWLGGANGFVRTWYDQSENGYDATQTTNASQPAFVASGINSKPSVDFNGTSQYMRGDGLAAAVTGEDKPLTAFSAAVADNMPVSPSSVLWGFGNTIGIGNPVIWFIPYNSVLFSFKRTTDGAGSVTALFSPVANAEDFIHTFRDTGLNVANYKNGSPGSVSNYNIGGVSLNTFSFGAAVRSSVSNYFNGRISEAIFINRAVDATDHNTIGADMADTYGLTWTTVS